MRKEYTYWFLCLNCKVEWESDSKDVTYCSKCGSENIKFIEKEETELC